MQMFKFGQDVGIDLGTATVIVYVKGKGIVLREPSVVAVDNHTGDVLAVGQEARRMLGRTPGNIVATRPLRDGVISDYTVTEKMLKHFINKVCGKFIFAPRIMICIPSQVTEVEKKAFFDLVVHSTDRAREVNIVERGIADAIGLNLDVENTKGLFIVNFGGATTELSIIAGGGLVLNQLLKVGGSDLDQAVAQLVRYNHDFLIGHQTAETLRRNFGVFSDDDNAVMTAAGRDLITGIPQRREISINLVRAAVKEPLEQCVQAIMALMDRTPPEIRKSIRRNGIFLTGGVANLPGLELYLEEMTGIRTHTAIDPDICAVTGLKNIIGSKDLKKLAYSMIEDNYRWMR